METVIGEVYSIAYENSISISDGSIAPLLLFILTVLILFFIMWEGRF